jgi:hypothetical protein
MARFANLLARDTGDESRRALGAQAMRYLAIGHRGGRDVPWHRPGILLADAELRGAPAHVTVNWPKGDAGRPRAPARPCRCPGVYRRIEWWDRAEGALRNADVAYPALDRPAAFFCTQAGARCPRSRRALWPPG